MQRLLKTIKTLSCWYSLDSSYWVLSNEFPDARVLLIFSPFLRHFVLAKLATRSIRVTKQRFDKNNIKGSCIMCFNLHFTLDFCYQNRLLLGWYPPTPPPYSGILAATGMAMLMLPPFPGTSISHTDVAGGWKRERLSVAVCRVLWQTWCWSMVEAIDTEINWIVHTLCIPWHG